MLFSILAKAHHINNIGQLFVNLLLNSQLCLLIGRFVWQIFPFLLLKANNIPVSFISVLSKPLVLVLFIHFYKLVKLLILLGDCMLFNCFLPPSLKFPLFPLWNLILILQELKAIRDTGNALYIRHCEVLLRVTKFAARLNVSSPLIDAEHFVLFFITAHIDTSLS